METVKLYDADAYAKKFTSKVVSAKMLDNERIEVVLEETLFFPEEGGQSPDKGVLGGYPVVDVQIRGGVIKHTLLVSDAEVCTDKGDMEVARTEDQPSGTCVAGGQIPAAGQLLEGRIDFAHRFSNMQQHSGEHIFSGIVHARFGLDNVGFHLSDNIVTMDYNGELTYAQLLEVQSAVNQAIARNIEIRAYYPDAEELSMLSYRSKKEIDGATRIVEIPGYDVCACCAPHVRRTGEIGLLKLISRQNYKGGVRVSILCGARAVMLFDEEHRMLTELAASLSTSPDQIGKVLEKQQAEIYALKGKLRDSAATLLQSQIAEVAVEQENVFLFAGDVDNKAVREAVNRLAAEHDGFCGIFYGSDTDGYGFIAAAGAKDKDAGTVSGLLKSALGARGGGSRQMVQGSVKASREEIQRCLGAL